MPLELKNEYAKKTYSDAEITSYAGQDFVIGYLGCELHFGLPLPNSNDIYSKVDAGDMSGGFVNVEGTGTYWANLQKSLYRFKMFDNRKIGLVLGQNDDGSLIVALLGSDTFEVHDVNKTKRIFRYYWNCSRVNDTGEGRFPFPASGTWVQGNDVNSPDFNVTKIGVSKYANSGFISVDDSFNSIPNWNEVSQGGSVVPTFFSDTCEYNGSLIGGDSGHIDFTLTDNKNTTFVIGDGTECEYFICDTEVAKLGHQRYDGMAGDLYSMMYDYAVWFSGRARQRGHEAYDFYPNHMGKFDLNDYVGPFHGGTYAFQWIPYNLILTENETEAKEYLRSGRIPSDAWIYPWNPDEFPSTSPINPDDDGEPSGDEGDPDGKTPDLVIDDMNPVTPVTTPQSLNPNNLYWLQKGQLATFFNWFWLDAGTIIDAGDLWDKIRGLYNDLASAVINVRYMPVLPAWIGGTSSATNIIVGQIECPMANVETINRNTQIIRDVGVFDLAGYLRKNFIDYSPHTEISLYLPYHGFIALDSDLVDTIEKIDIKCVYDIISGTIQYMIFAKDKSNNKALINSCISKMAVDIPVTLQSKSDRDSAIFNNVMNATAGLMSAGVSLAMKNPVGMALSIGGAVGSGTQSAQLSVKGTTGESGAFFMPQKCAIFIKKSFYKLPSKYGLHIGYPCFKSYKMDSKSLKGQMVKIQNPYIDFSGNLYTRDEIKVRNKPLKSEIDKIYELLKEGVII